nr:tetraacyldisaccharide 4'-kinase [Campylobacter sp.]
MSSSALHNLAYKYFYSPNLLCKFICVLLSPLSLFYAFLVWIKFILSNPQKYQIPIISVGNLILGGTGKTPLIKAIFNKFSTQYSVFIVLRGYKRKSKGLLVVCDKGEIKCSVDESGDEAMEYALSLKNATVIVSENRKIAIQKAINLGANLILLDDGFGKFDIFKFNILLKPPKKPALNLTIPSGVYRYPKSFYKFSDFIPQDSDIIKTSYIQNKSEKMVLVSAIANPFRLHEFEKICINSVFFADHYDFKKHELEQILRSNNATSLLVTQKDYVKIKDFGLPLSIIILDTKISSNFAQILENFIKNYNKFAKIHAKKEK